MAVIVVLGSYALLNAALTFAVSAAWAAGLRARVQSQAALLGLRLLPSAGATLLTLTIALPAFLRFEPWHGPETPGALIVMLAAVTVGLALLGALRAVRAIASTRAVAVRWKALRRQQSPGGLTMDVVDVPSPIVAVSGVWRPRLLIGRDVASHCTAEELALIIAHEEAHVRARDNFKHLLMLVSPDLLASLPAGRALEERWRAATEHAADEYATKGAPEHRVRLATALVKMARLALTTPPQPGVASTLIGADGIEGRIRRLLDRPPGRPSMGYLWIAPVLLLVCAAIAIGEHQGIHAAIEQMVGIGR
jgi:beta-lactamase regulating signal transducer with metallopeptidase domain